MSVRICVASFRPLSKPCLTAVRQRHHATHAEADAGLVADNPGVWMLHCHNTYHLGVGMMTSLNDTS